MAATFVVAVALVAPGAAFAAPVTLAQPVKIYRNGPLLTWSQHTGGGFTAYEVHRGTAAAFTPTSATLVTSISNIGTVEYRDTGRDA